MEVELIKRPLCIHLVMCVCETAKTLSRQITCRGWLPEAARMSATPSEVETRSTRSSLGKTSGSSLALFAIDPRVMEASLAACLFAALAARSSELLEVVLSLVESFLAEQLFPTFFARAVAFFDASFFFRGDFLVCFLIRGFLMPAFLSSVFF